MEWTGELEGIRGKINQVFDSSGSHIAVASTILRRSRGYAVHSRLYVLPIAAPNVAPGSHFHDFAMSSSPHRCTVFPSPRAKDWIKPKRHAFALSRLCKPTVKCRNAFLS